MNWSFILNARMKSSPRLTATVLLGVLLVTETFTVSGVSAASKPYYRYPLSLLPEKPDVRESTTHVGSGTYAQYGAVLSRGDLNGDGHDDLIVSSPYFSTDDRKQRGRVEIYLGSKTFFAAGTTGAPDASAKPDVTFLGSRAESQLGTSVATGDLNGDAITDVIIGAPGDRAVLIMFGKATFQKLATFDFSQKSADWHIQGRDDDDRFGFAIDSADINGDATDDLIMSAPFAGKEGVKRLGKVYVVYGSSYRASSLTYYLSSSSPDAVFWGTKEDDSFGITLAHGDIDGDKKVDLAVGSYMATSGSSKQAGTVTLLYGSRLSAKKELQVVDDPELPVPSEKTDETLFTVDRSFNWFGYALTFGDLNNDQLDDLVISAFPYLKNNKQGQIYILWGDKKGNFESKTLSRVIAPNETSLIGSAVAISDMNGDGAPDLMIGGATGAPGSDRGFGRLYILSFFPRNKELWNFSEVPPDMMIEGRAERDWFGNSFIMGDFDTDGSRDIIIGAPNTRGTGVGGSLEFLRGPIFPHGDTSYTPPSPPESVSRGSFVVEIMKSFQLDKKNKEYIDSCLADAEFCFYQFSSQTKYAGLRFTPNIRLYPDVRPTDPFYKYVNNATILGIIRGFSEEHNSPFHPDKPISRIHALKILLTSTNMLPWKDYADLRNELVARNAGALADSRRTASARDSRDKDPMTSQKMPYMDVSARVEHMWWYPRYINYAYLSGIIDDSVFFQPDAPLTQKDFDHWMVRVQEQLSRRK